MNEEYMQLFRMLEISIEPLPENYTPEEYGRKLLSESQTKLGVSYSASTEYIDNSKNTIDNTTNQY